MISKYNGPSSGPAGDDDQEFRDSGNPYAQGRPSNAGDTSAARPADLGFNQGSPLGYYTNPLSDPSNPHSAGAPAVSGQDDSFSGDIGASLDGLYGDIMANRQPDPSPMPSSDAYVEMDRIDNGQDDQRVPPGQRR